MGKWIISKGRKIKLLERDRDFGTAVSVVEGREEGDKGGNV